MLAVAVACGLMIPHIRVNSDMTKYLPKDSPMKHGVDRMAEAFPGRTLNMATVRAMYRGLAPEVHDSLSGALPNMEGVELLTSVRVSGDYTLYELMVRPDGDPKALAAELRGGDREVLVETSIDGNLPDVSVFIIAAIIIFVILFLMCESWFEPLLYLVTIGVAVVINMGTNALLPEVSMTTNAIVAILQLVLSMDYSIILMNRYRQEKARGLTPVEAMRLAVENATPSVLASALTTIAGMLMLCFMKFRIGLDLGFVLAKGVFCSIFCLYTVLPALIVAFDSLLEKGRKRVFSPNTDRLAAFEHCFRCPLAIAAVLIFGGSAALSKLTPITFSTNWPTAISEVFPRDNSVVLLYDNRNEEALLDIADALALDPHVDTVVSYPTLMLRRQTEDEMLLSVRSMAGMMGPSAARMMDSFLTPETMRLLFDLLNDPAPSAPSLPPAPPVASAAPPAAPKSAVRMAPPPAAPVSADESVTAADSVPLPAPSCSPAAAAPKAPRPLPPAAQPWNSRHFEQMTAESLAAFLGFNAKQALSLYKMAGRRGGTFSPFEFVHFVTEKVLANRIYSSFITADEKKALLALQDEMDAEVRRIEEAERQRRQLAEQPPSPPAPAPDTLAAAADSVAPQAVRAAPAPEAPRTAPAPPLSADSAAPQPPVVPHDLLCAIHVSIPDPAVAGRGADSLRPTVSLSQLVSFLTNDLVQDPAFASYLSPEIRDRIGLVRSMVDQGMGQLRGNGYSMAAIVTDYPDEGDDIAAFLQNLHKVCAESLQGNYYLIGESVMFDEMSRGFAHELLVVTLLTILAIFLIVALSFRSAVVPAILIMTVLSGVYVNVFVSGIGGGHLLYLAYLIVQSILMGATIDYAILFTNYYREHRRALDIPAALMGAYRGSMRTILTSGLIIVLGPGAMSFLVADPTISAIVGSLAIGGCAAVLLILFLLPALLAAADPLIVKHPSRAS